MKCLVTAGPTYETLDNVRRLTNFSTGKLGAELASFLVDQGHEVFLLLGHCATYPGPQRAQRLERFTTTADLQSRLERSRSSLTGAVFHAAAASDFTFGKVWRRTPAGELREVKSGKYSTRQGPLLAELVPTPKIINHLRDWFPEALLVGWKYEVDGDRASAITAAATQLCDNRTDACVINGPAYGEGFGWLSCNRDCQHLPDQQALFLAVKDFLNPNH